MDDLQLLRLSALHHLLKKIVKPNCHTGMLQHLLSNVLYQLAQMHVFSL